MKQLKLKPKVSTLATITMFVLLTGAVIYQSLLIMVLIDRAKTVDRETLWNTKLIYACYNHKIYPCDDEGTSKWNEQHPDQAITPEYLRDPVY